jgi:hypothetical protein
MAVTATLRALWSTVASGQNVAYALTLTNGGGSDEELSRVQKNYPGGAMSNAEVSFPDGTIPAAGSLTVTWQDTAFAGWTGDDNPSVSHPIEVRAYLDDGTIVVPTGDPTVLATPERFFVPVAAGSVRGDALEQSGLSWWFGHQ